MMASEQSHGLLSPERYQAFGAKVERINTLCWHYCMN